MSIQSEINRIAGAKSDIADAIEGQGVTVPSGTKLDGMANLIGQISGGSEKLNSTQAADAYDPTATYAVGDKVSYAGNVYSCISAISTPEAWDSTHWDQVDPIQDQVDDVRNTLNTKADQESLALRRSGATNTGAQIENGTYFYLDGTLKQAIATIAQNASFTAQNCETVTAGGLNSLKNESGDDYCKMPDGTLIQWGTMTNLTVDLTAEGSSGLYSQRYTADSGIVFPISFKDTNYVVSGSFQYGTGSPFPITVGFNARTKTFCYPELRQTLTQLRDPLISLASRDFTRISRDKTTLKEGDSHGRNRRRCRLGD